MAENVTLARPYAEAAFKIAREANQLEEWSAALARMSAIVADPDMRGLIGNPKAGATVVAELLVDVAGGNLSQHQRNFVTLLADNDRLSVLPEINELFGELKDRIEGVRQAQITSAYLLDPDTLRNLVASIERRFLCKIDASVEVDPDLIGGVRIAVGDQVIDASVRAKLAQMATALKN